MSQRPTQDMENGNSNFTVTFDSPMDSLLEKIIRAETGPWWTLMHRCKLCSSLMTKALEGKNPEADLSKLFVWMRLSALKQLTWQRNYNTKPRELSAAQAALTSKFADFYKLDPTLRPIMQVRKTPLHLGRRNLRIAY
jgi:alpha-glucan,water dikinase